MTVVMQKTTKNMMACFHLRLEQRQYAVTEKSNDGMQ